MGETSDLDAQLMKLLGDDDRAPDEGFVRQAERALSVRIQISQSRNASIRAAVSDVCSLLAGAGALVGLVSTLDPVPLILPSDLAMSGGSVAGVLIVAAAATAWLIASSRCAPL